MSGSGKALIVPPGSSPELHAFGNVLSVLLSGEQTGGKIAVMSEWTPPGGGPPLHRHNNEDEIFLVVEGRISYFAEGKWSEVAAGGAVYLPAGAAHCYRNIGAAPSRHWILTMPSGFEKFFAECADEFTRPGGADPQRIAAIHSQHGIQLLDE